MITLKLIVVLLAIFYIIHIIRVIRLNEKEIKKGSELINKFEKEKNNEL